MAARSARASVWPRSLVPPNASFVTAFQAAAVRHSEPVALSMVTPAGCGTSSKVSAALRTPDRHKKPVVRAALRHMSSLFYVMALSCFVFQAGAQCRIRIIIDTARVLTIHIGLFAGPFTQEARPHSWHIPGIRHRVVPCCCAEGRSYPSYFATDLVGVSTRSAFRKIGS